MIGFCRSNGIDLVVVGPETPLCAGIVDHLEAAASKPSGRAAWRHSLKGPKALPRISVAPTESNRSLRALSRGRAAKAYARSRGAPIVVKADGLAAGKGVIVAETLAEAEAAIDMIFGGTLGEAGAELH